MIWNPKSGRGGWLISVEVHVSGPSCSGVFLGHVRQAALPEATTTNSYEIRQPRALWEASPHSSMLRRIARSRGHGKRYDFRRVLFTVASFARVIPVTSLGGLGVCFTTIGH